MPYPHVNQLGDMLPASSLPPAPWRPRHATPARPFLPPQARATSPSRNVGGVGARRRQAATEPESMASSSICNAAARERRRSRPRAARAAGALTRRRAAPRRASTRLAAGEALRPPPRARRGRGSGVRHRAARRPARCTSPERAPGPRTGRAAGRCCGRLGPAVQGRPAAPAAVLRKLHLPPRRRSTSRRRSAPCVDAHDRAAQADLVVVEVAALQRDDGGVHQRGQRRNVGPSGRGGSRARSIGRPLPHRNHVKSSRGTRRPAPSVAEPAAPPPSGARRELEHCEGTGRKPRPKRARSASPAGPAAGRGPITAGPPPPTSIASSTSSGSARMRSRSASAEGRVERHLHQHLGIPQPGSMRRSVSPRAHRARIAR